MKQFFTHKGGRIDFNSISVTKKQKVISSCKVGSVSVLLFLIASYVATSPILRSFIPISFIYLALGSLLTFIFIKIVLLHQKISLLVLSGILLQLVFTLVYALHWEEIKPIAYPLHFIVAVVCGSLISRKELYSLTSVLFWVTFTMVILSIIGFLYAFAGGSALYVIQNSNGRNAYLYLTTMTNFVVGNFIRPAGIFDEPGTLSFFICIVCTLRKLLGVQTQKDIVLLFLGLVTFSVAHVVFIFFYFLSERIHLRGLILFCLVVLFVAFIIDLNSSSVLVRMFDHNFVQRFTIVDGKFRGDNRSDLFFNAISLLNLKCFFWGIDVTYIIDPTKCQALYAPFGENVLTLLVGTGFGMSIPYYITLLYLIIVGVRNRNQIYLVGFALLLMQRPFTMLYGYSPLIVLIIMTIIRKFDSIQPEKYKSEFEFNVFQFKRL